MTREALAWLQQRPAAASWLFLLFVTVGLEFEVALAMISVELSL